MCFWRGCRVSVGQTVRGDGGSATQVPSCRSRWPKHGALLPWLLCNINCFKLLTFGNLAAMLSSTSRLEQVVLLNWSSHFSCLHLVSPPSYALQPARYGHPLLKLQLVEAAAWRRPIWAGWEGEKSELLIEQQLKMLLPLVQLLLLWKKLKQLLWKEPWKLLLLR